MNVDEHATQQILNFKNTDKRLLKHLVMKGRHK